MAGKRKSTKTSNLKRIPGHPGLYTFVKVTRNPRKEKAFIAKVLRGARKLECERLAREAFFSKSPR